MERLIDFVLNAVPVEWLVIGLLASLPYAAPWAWFRLRGHMATVRADSDDAVVRARRSRAAREADDEREAEADRIAESARNRERLAEIHKAAMESSRLLRAEASTADSDRAVARQWLPTLAQLIPGRRPPRPTSFGVAAIMRRLRSTAATAPAASHVPLAEVDAWCMAWIARGRPASSAAALVANHTVPELREFYSVHKPELVADVDALMAGHAHRVELTA